MRYVIRGRRLFQRLPSATRGSASASADYIGAELRAWFRRTQRAIGRAVEHVAIAVLSALGRGRALGRGARPRRRWRGCTLTDTKRRSSCIGWRLRLRLCVWLQPVIQQAHAVCLRRKRVAHAAITTRMPDADSAALMMLSAFIIEHLSVPIGILLPLLFAAAQVITGFYSIGQVVTGLAIGGVMHLLQTRTPGFVRIVEFALSLIGSVVAFVLVKRFDATVDVSQGALAFSGALWQLAALLMPVIWFDWSLVKEALRKAPSTLHPVDFLYYVPLLEASVQFNLTEPEQDLAGNSKLLRKERRLLQTTLLLSALMILLAGVRVAQPHLNDWFVTKA
jgi:hypothetical protein